jgi:2-polyprenyl-3-methyl-5-hydroxy-6-metoxy-1,4-benzoquinol methylase
VAADGVRPVRLLKGTVDWHDGSEQRVIDVLEQATDLADGSDELAAFIDDWPTRYHFSPKRANLLRPFRFGPGTRVLDAGAGSGALARHVGETGASVVALEGNRARAEAAGRRCDGLDNVEVVCGRVTDFDDEAGFDVVLCVGVLEHTAPDHEQTLAHLRRLTGPDGVLILAIENQLGLRYLLGDHEDHLLEPWAGVEGYPGTDHVRTFSRDRLRRMLETAGFPEQHWLYPFPDYKLPVAVLADSAYETLGRHFVDQLVRWPDATHASPRSRLCDERLAHNVFLDAGLGPAVANSFLVLAGGDAGALAERIDAGAGAWYFGAERLRMWRSAKVFRAAAGEVVALPAPAVPVQRASSWLRQERPSCQPLFAGPTLEQLFLEACTQSVDEACEVLRRWRAHAAAAATAAGELGPDHPFRRTTTTTLLPADHLDVNLANYVSTEDGVVFVDSEWVAAGPVDADLVLLRALWGLAADLVRRSVIHPWPSELPVDALAAVLGAACDVPAAPGDLHAWREAEAELLSIVYGGKVEDHLDWLVQTGQARRADADTRAGLPFTTLRREVAGAHQRITSLTRQLNAAEAQTDDLGRLIADLRSQLDASARQAAAARTEARTLIDHLRLAREAEAAAIAFQRRALAELANCEHVRSELDAHRRRWDRIERHPAMRLYRKLRPPG